MKSSAIVLLLFHVVSFCQCFEIFGYVPDYRIHSIKWDEVMPYLTTLILFSLEISPRGDLAIVDRIPGVDSERWASMKSAAREHNTRLFVCIGGAGRAGGLGIVMPDPELRSKLVKHVINLLDERELDGVDFDFEMPGDKEHQDQLGAFLKEMHDATKKAGKLLSVALHPGARQRLPESVVTSADFVHIMAYDNWCAFPASAIPPCKHSELEYAKDIIVQIKSIPYFRPKTTTLGIPFYGRHVTNGRAKGYADIKTIDPKATSDTDEIDGFSFNNELTVQKKVELAFNNKLGGVMIWEIGQDKEPTSKDALLPLVWRTVQNLLKKDEL